MPGVAFSAYQSSIENDLCREGCQSLAGVPLRQFRWDLLFDGSACNVPLKDVNGKQNDLTSQTGVQNQGGTAYLYMLEINGIFDTIHLINFTSIVLDIRIFLQHSNVTFEMTCLKNEFIINTSGHQKLETASGFTFSQQRDSNYYCEGRGKRD